MRLRETDFGDFGVYGSLEFSDIDLLYRLGRKFESNGPLGSSGDRERDHLRGTVEVKIR